ncbi:hypothetical protein CC78DRAFT_584678 [Lojkania enalia]|uniref:Uncharacterized protein n=1 Tax=Lojkania enalia TaxID=147567 RepID=A0A9P4K5M2_9PLEO|nr:hypothetical protein CC78DRAFT_584678 [Didymosphaeria enalia]
MHLHIPYDEATAPQNVICRRRCTTRILTASIESIVAAACADRRALLHPTIDSRGDRIIASALGRKLCGCLRSRDDGSTPNASKRAHERSMAARRETLCVAYQGASIAEANIDVLKEGVPKMHMSERYTFLKCSKASWTRHSPCKLAWNSDLEPTASSLDELQNEDDSATCTLRFAPAQTALPEFNPNDATATNAAFVGSILLSPPYSK